MRPSVLAGIAAALLLAPAPAWAHDALGDPAGFAAGFVHPLAGLDHLLAMVAVGLWGAILGRPLIAALPVVFPAFMAAGALVGMSGTVLPAPELGIAGSLVALGLAVGAGWRAPVWAAGLLAGGFGLFHGYAHGQELPVAADPGAYCAGFVLATGLLHGTGVALGAARARAWGDPLMRGAGFAMAAAGLFFVSAATRT